MLTKPSPETENLPTPLYGPSIFTVICIKKSYIFIVEGHTKSYKSHTFSKSDFLRDPVFSDRPVLGFQSVSVLQLEFFSVSGRVGKGIKVSVSGRVGKGK